MYKPWLITIFASSAYSYQVLRDYSGTSFFDEWDFYGFWDNLTLGNVNYLNQTDAASQGLAYINEAGSAVIRVDNFSTVALGENRNSVRITTKDSFTYGSLWVIDLKHIPFGCSVWPAFWSMGPLWPNDGEIDIVEAINLMTNNQMALHTVHGCFHTTPSDQTGQSSGLGPGNTGAQNFNAGGPSDCSTGAGCVVSEKQGSWGEAFAANGGGVWATQFDEAGVFIWYWPRDQVPASINGSTPTTGIGLNDWGPPSGSFPSGQSCNITDFFTSQQLVLDITLCGDWAGVPQIYGPKCGKSGPTGLCYNDTVVGNGANYADAYFEVDYIRVFTTGMPVPTTTAAKASRQTATSNGSDPFRLLHTSSWLPWMVCILGVLLGGMIVP